MNLSKFIVYSCEKHEVFAEWHQQLAHRNHRGTRRNKIVEYYNVALGGRCFTKGKNSPDTMLRVALGNVFVERYTEQFGEASGNERGEVSLLVATLGRGNDAPVAGSERMTENLPDKGVHTLGKLLDHIGVALNVGQRPAIERLFPERYDAELRIAV